MLTNVESLINDSFGSKGTPERDSLEERAELFVITEMIKEARREAHLTQAQLAERIGAKKGYISRIENGKTDIQLRTLKRIVEKGLGKKLKLVFE